MPFPEKDSWSGNPAPVPSIARKRLPQPHVFSGDHHPTAVFCGNDEMAMQVYNAATSLGLSIHSRPFRGWI